MQYFYFETTKKYVIAFASLFNNIKIQRFDRKNGVIKEITVPITFGAKDKLYDYLMHQNSEEIATFLPRIGFSLVSMDYDSTRKRQVGTELLLETTEEKIMYEGVPYNFSFEVNVWTKYFEDNLQIVEQICSQFTPDIEITVIEEETLGLKRDISISLSGVQINSDLEVDEGDLRIIQSTLSFILEGYIYPPITDAKIIKQINLNAYAESYKKTELAFSEIILP